jgi:hypothetical protein
LSARFLDQHRESSNDAYSPFKRFQAEKMLKEAP